MMNARIPFTGDETQVIPYIVICAIAVVAIVALIIAASISRKKKLESLDANNPELEMVDLDDSDEISKEESKED